MKRVYNNDTIEQLVEEVRFFIGEEVENTPQLGEKTLFVVGLQNYDDIVKYAGDTIKHIYLGANMSWTLDDSWDSMVFPLLKDGYWVTLDFPNSDIEWVLESGYTEYNRFIPMISVPVPYIEQLGYNACLKIDDKGFDASNPGVWVHSVHSLKDQDVFTHWSKYTKDSIIS